MNKLENTPNSAAGGELDRTRERLVDREARLNAVLDTAVDGIITIDQEGVIESVNAATERIFGYSAEELLGRNISVLMPAPDRDRHDGYIRRYIETGEARIIGIGREVEGLRRDGSTFPLELAVSQISIAGKRLFTGILRDISDRRDAEEEARKRREELSHASRLSTIGELSSGIAHEINQPLTAIVTFAEACLRMLRAAKPDTERLESALEQIVQQGQRAGHITRQLRRLARRGERERIPIDLNALLRDILGMVSNEMKMYGIRLVLELDESLPMVECNRIQIEQVVLNLVRNAMDALEAGPGAGRALTIRTRRDGDLGVLLEVEDTGGGFGDVGVDRVFETFFTTKPEGVGMGLSISRTIIEDHGGRLWASEGARGAVFHVQLPVAGDAGG